MSNWRTTREYRVWRAGVIRTHVRCAVCDSMENRHAHHVNHATYFPEQRFDQENGVVLCGKCHSQFHNNFKRSTRTKCTRYDYDNFLALVLYLKTYNA